MNCIAIFWHMRGFCQISLLILFFKPALLGAILTTGPTITRIITIIEIMGEVLVRTARIFKNFCWTKAIMPINQITKERNLWILALIIFLTLVTNLEFIVKFVKSKHTQPINASNWGIYFLVDYVVHVLRRMSHLPPHLSQILPPGCLIQEPLIIWQTMTLFMVIQHPILAMIMSL